jgi:hypothetical protein
MRTFWTFGLLAFLFSCDTSSTQVTGPAPTSVIQVFNNTDSADLRKFWDLVVSPIERKDYETILKYTPPTIDGSWTIALHLDSSESIAPSKFNFHKYYLQVFNDFLASHIRESDSKILESWYNQKDSIYYRLNIDTLQLDFVKSKNNYSLLSIDAKNLGMCSHGK